MSNNNDQRRRAFKPLRLKLSEIDDREIREKLQLQFDEVQFKRSQAVGAARESAIADRQRSIAQAEAEISFIKLMQEAGEYLDPIKTEPIWAAFREKGDVVFECPFSENDMRNSMKVQRAQMEQQAQQVEENGGGLYEGDEEEPEGE